jgi:putative Mg2+ transporter-C (MgtC) family protein
MVITTLDASLRLFLSILFGSIVGVEREMTQKSAGLRTHILVCLGSAVFTLMSACVAAGPHADPGRIAAQIVTGIGFVGGGAVLKHGNNIHGITTAASLWVMASIGMLTGFGYYRLAAVATVLAFLVLFSIGNIEKMYLNKHTKYFPRLRLEVSVNAAQFQDVQQWVEKHVSSEILA